MILPLRSKAGAGYDTDFFFRKKPVAEFFLIHPCTADIRENIEGALRFEDCQTDIHQPLIDHFTAGRIFLKHSFYIIITVSECFDRTILAGRGSAEDLILMYLVDLLECFPRSTNVADTKARHRIRLGETIQDDRAFLHVRQRSEAGMLPLIRQIAVDFIRDDDEVMGFGKSSDLFQRRSVHDRSGRIIRISDQDGLRLWRDFLFEFFYREAEFILRIGRYQDRYAVRNRNAGRIRQIGRIRDQHFISRIQESRHDKADGF